MYSSMYPSPLLDEPLQLPQQTTTAAATGAGQVLKVVMLNGDEFQVTYNGNMTIDQLKGQLFTATQVVPGKQKLLFQGQELVRTPARHTAHAQPAQLTRVWAATQTPVVESRPRSLADNHVGPGATLHMLVLLYEFENSDINKVIFELNWTFPGTETDFLDGSCLRYQGPTLVDVVDYQHCKADGIRHSGDVMKATSGHHDMRIQLDAVPKHIDRLFFALSAYRCRNLSLFRNPSVTIYDERRPTKQLCQYAISSAGASSAVIMCCLCRSPSGGWYAITIGRHSGGTVLDYAQMQGTCRQLVLAQTNSL
jgi:stress response protein SCP2